MLFGKQIDRQDRHPLAQEFRAERCFWRKRGVRRRASRRKVGADSGSMQPLSAASRRPEGPAAAVMLENESGVRGRKGWRKVGVVPA